MLYNNSTASPAGDVAMFLAGFAALASARRQFEQAAQLCGTVEVLQATRGGGCLDPANQRVYDGICVTVRVHLDEEAFAAAWEAGSAMPLEQALTGNAQKCSYGQP
jgi:hypothetical protein